MDKSESLFSCLKLRQLSKGRWILFYYYRYPLSNFGKSRDGHSRFP